MARQVSWKPRLIHPTISTSESLNRLTCVAETLWWRLVANADDQGRLSGVPRNIKYNYAQCREEITIENIPVLLEEMQAGKTQAEWMIAVYGNPPVIQLLRWWDWEHPQWAVKSAYPAFNGWQDHLRYHEGQRVVTENWPPPRTVESVEVPTILPTQVPRKVPTILPTSEEHKEEQTEGKKEKLAAPLAAEAKLFLDMVALHENVKLLNFAKLLGIVRRVLVATEASVEDLLLCYTAMRSDKWWATKTPPDVITKLPDQFPTYLKLKAEGRLNDFLKRLPKVGPNSRPDGWRDWEEVSNAGEPPEDIH